MTSEPSEPQPHYFQTPDPDAARSHRELELVLAGQELTLEVTGGVFSQYRLDLGTRVLLREVPAPPPAGDLLDLGCGWGPLAITQALLSPEATVWAVDVNELALELTATNAGRAGVTNVRPAAPDSVPDDLRFAAIWSNPPIRIGKPALHELLLHWLPRLVPGGQAHLVVQRHLGADSLQRWLQENLPAGWTVDRAGSAKGYRVFQVTSPA
jgi:16S rRNA (guanine1207-N2)-methyltransferase